MLRNYRVIRSLAAAIFLLLLAAVAHTQTPSTQQANQTASGATLRQYCASCHSAAIKSGGVVIDPANIGDLTKDAETWERVVRQLRAQAMPPPGAPRPNKATYDSVAGFLETSLDRASATNPNAGSLPHLHRLTRTEYANAIRDLLAIENLPKEMEYSLLLPSDNASSGFDNIADLLFVSPATMERYLDAARKISRLAVGDPNMPLMVNIHRTSIELPQSIRVEELPLGTRGGIAVKSYFPLDGEYDFQLDMGAARDHQLEILIDGETKQTVAPAAAAAGPAGRGAAKGGPGPGAAKGGAPGPGAAKGGGGRGAANVYRVPVTAGPHLVGVTFVQKNEAFDETTLRTRGRSRGSQPSVNAVTIRGPYNATGPGTTPSRERIFVCRPQNAAEEVPCARRILSTLAHRAYKKPLVPSDVDDLMPFYEAGRKERDFDFGIQSALERLLISPQFLYRIEREPANAVAGRAFRITDLELASRISFFLWSSIPDDELLTVAEQGRLRQPEVLRAQIKRMLADRKSEALVTNFAAQWLFLRDIGIKEADIFLFRDFDEGLRKSMNRETEMFLDSILLEDRPITDLINVKYSFLDERLAKHYGIPGVRGSHFRRVDFPADSPRGGLLGQSSVLWVTSYSTRTSPVLRGKYVLENLLASPPPPPPPNVPSLNTEGESTDKPPSMREAMELHRKANSVCAGCHARMDPIGFALENFDATGRWRDHMNGEPIDTASKLPNGTEVNGLDGVKKLLLSDPERFAGAVTEKLMMYAIGRNVQYYDAPAVRQVVRQAAAQNYRFSALVEGIVTSTPFQMRTAATQEKR